MNAWRVTPTRLASRSMACSKSTGKSTLTRCTARPGRVALVTSRCAVRSFPASCNSSSRAALNALVGEIARFFLWTCTADRDDADRFFMAMCHRGTPRGLRYPSNDEGARLVHRPRRQFDPVEIQPQGLRVDEVDAVLRLVRGRFRGVEVEPQRGIESIPSAGYGFSSGMNSEMRSSVPTPREMCPLPVTSSARRMCPGPSGIFWPPTSSISPRPLSVITY